MASWRGSKPWILSDWGAAPAQLAQGWHVAPGVFSADGVDQASLLLADALPPLQGAIADLGAGWGYLSARALADGGERITALHVVEAFAPALDCARSNVTDKRAVFHWADARTWRAPGGALDMVIMNPPFHTGRDATASLGQAFIHAAAALLKPRGSLWLVANRHLPYENTLRAQFAEVTEMAGDHRFKVLEAKGAGPARRRPVT